ncbi:MAG: hypothetical protein CMN34_00190 [Saprospirales bacterium]|nr:hypothetical protein [Saprospirales bacterium]|tara:strand:+ start:659 stop:1180 length:522 start_codon:yes stop_codon:yes gene_type:complete
MQGAIPTLKTIGKVGRPHGYKGNLRVFLDYDLVIDSPLWLWLDFGYDFIPFTIEEIIRQQGRDWVIKLKNCSSEEEVKQYVNASLAISEEDFKHLLPESENIESWIGWNAVDADGQPIGVVHSIDQSTVNGIIEIQHTSGSMIIVPHTPQVVLLAENGQLTLSLPDGLLDVYL